MALGKHNPITTRHSNSLNHCVIPHSSVSSGFRKDLKISYFFPTIFNFFPFLLRAKQVRLRASLAALQHFVFAFSFFLSFFNLFLKDRRERKKIRNFQMEEGKGSTLVHLLVLVLSLVAFGFAIAAERRRSIGHIEKDATNATYCVYNSDAATGYGVGAFLFLLSSESLLMGITKCMCFGRSLAPGGDRAWAIIYFVSSWATFLVAEGCLIAGAKKNAYHTKYRGMIYAQNFTCETLRKGVFIAGAVFVVATMILNVYYYMYFSKATASKAAHKTNRTSSVGMTGNP